jgi:hypothetical protein
VCRRGRSLPCRLALAAGLPPDAHWGGKPARALPAQLLSGAAGGNIANMARALTVIGVPRSAGAHHAGLETAPAALRAAGLLDRLRQAGCELSDVGDLTARVFTANAAHPRARNRDAVVRACRDVAAAVGSAIAAGRVPVLLGGDCSITAGPWRAAWRSTRIRACCTWTAMLTCVHRRPRLRAISTVW